MMVIKVGDWVGDIVRKKRVKRMKEKKERLEEYNKERGLRMGGEKKKKTI